MFVSGVDHVQLVDRGDAELNRCRSESVALGDCILHHEPEPREADEVKMGFTRAHARAGRQNFQRQLGLRHAELADQRKADLDRLDAAPRIGGSALQLCPEGANWFCLDLLHFTIIQLSSTKSKNS